MSELGPIPAVLQALYADEQTAPACGDDERAWIRARVLATVGAAVDTGGSVHRPPIDPAREEVP